MSEHGTARSVCPPTLTIAEVGPYWSELSSLLEKGPLDVDASQITRLDAAGAQLLYLLSRPAHSEGTRVQNPSEVARSLASVLGFEL